MQPDERSKGSTVHGRQLRHASNERVCAYEGCDTVLSAYNRFAFCWVHEDMVERAEALLGTRRKSGLGTSA